MSDNQNIALEAARKKIDQLDAGLIELLEARMEVSDEIARIKRSIGKDVYDRDLEQKLLDHLATLTKGEKLKKEHLLEIWGKIIEISKQLQSQV